MKLFTLECAIEDMLEQAKMNILEKSREVLEINDSILFEHLKVYYKALKGTECFDKLHQRVLNYKGNYTVSAVNNIRDVAIGLEKIDLNKSIDLMKIAQINRPNGIVIKNKMAEYLKKRNKS